MRNSIYLSVIALSFGMTAAAFAGQNSYSLLESDKAPRSFYGLYDVVAPVLTTDPDPSARQTGMIYYDNNAAVFKGVNGTGGVDILSTANGSPVSSTAPNQAAEWAILNNTGSACVILSQSGTWIASGTRNGTGDCSWTLTAGSFSAAPACVVTGQGNNVVRIVSTSTTLINTRTLGVTGMASDDGLHMICMGSR